MTLTRRELIRRSGILTGYFVAHAASTPFLSTRLLAQPGTFGSEQPVNRFPLGVASADPQPEMVLLWTRVEPLGEFTGFGPDEPLTLQVSTTDDFQRVVVERDIVATDKSDYTVRVHVTGLEPETTYYYRFVAADGFVSRTGRTWTAPPLDVERPLNVMLASCQGYPPIQFGAYRRFLLNQSLGKEPRADFVLHVGDYIYGLQGDEPLVPVGNMETEYERLLAGDRRTYRGYHRDRDLQDTRALYPFVCVWDDHEYANDAWQSMGTRGSVNQISRLTATQSWFEYVPQILEEALTIPGVENKAYSFRKPDKIEKAPLTRAFDEGFMSLEANNLAAINALRCYRTIRWGAMADLIIPDERSYRGPSANPGYSVEELAEGRGGASAFSGMSLYEGDLLMTLAKGKTANDGNPPETLEVRGQQLPNPRVNDPAVSMLGLEQKAWFKQSLKNSTARWKVIANSVPMKGFYFNTGVLDEEVGSGYKWTDSWDGFPNERAELMQFILDNGIERVVSLTGDRHAHYAGLVAVDYDAENPRYVIPEFTCASISAFLRSGDIAGSLERYGLGELGEFQRQLPDGSTETVSNLNVLMRYGARAAKVMAETQGDLAAALKEADPTVNPHLAYADNDAHGFVFAKFTADRIEVEFVTVPKHDWEPEIHPLGPPLRRVVTFETPAWEAGQAPTVAKVGEYGETNFGDG